MNFSIWKTGYAALVILGIVYALIVLRGPHGLSGLAEKRGQIHEIEKQNEVLHRENEALRLHIKNLGENAEEQEMEIRRRFKLVKPDETVYLLQDQDEPDAKPKTLAKP